MALLRPGLRVHFHDSPACSTGLCTRQPVQRWVSESAARSVRLHSLPTTTEEVKTQAYNMEMNSKMMNPYEYHPQRGLYWHEICPGLCCGSQPRTPQDVAALKQEGFTHIVNLQTDKDLQYWSVNLDDLKRQAEAEGVSLIRRSARDFDPHSLRKALPGAVSTVRQAISAQGRVYVHCTAGLGRAPAVCIAYMYWFMDMDLDQAYSALTEIRPCGPKRDAIRAATFDLLSGSPSDHFERLGKDAWAAVSEEDKYALQWRVLKGA